MHLCTPITRASPPLPPRVPCVTAKVTDFGLSRRLSLRDDSLVELVGYIPTEVSAPETMQPPSLFGMPSDVYSFGSVMWSIVEEFLPYHDMSPADIRAHVLNNPGALPGSSFSRHWTKTTMRLTQQCMSAAHQERPSMAQIVEALSEHQDLLQQRIAASRPQRS